MDVTDVDFEQVMQNYKFKSKAKTVPYYIIV